MPGGGAGLLINSLEEIIKKENIIIEPSKIKEIKNMRRKENCDRMVKGTK